MPCTNDVFDNVVIFPFDGKGKEADEADEDNGLAKSSRSGG